MGTIVVAKAAVAEATESKMNSFLKQITQQAPQDGHNGQMKAEPIRKEGENAI